MTMRSGFPGVLRDGSTPERRGQQLVRACAQRAAFLPFLLHPYSVTSPGCPDVATVILLIYPKLSLI